MNAILSPGAASLQDATAEDLQNLRVGEQVALLHGQGVAGLVGSIAAAGVLVAVLWGSTGRRAELLGWFALLCAINLLRHGALQLYQADAQKLSRGRTWGWRFAFGTAAAGLAWGLMAFTFFDQDLALMYPIVLALAGLVALSVATLGSFYPAHLAFALPCLLPLILRSLYEGGPLFVGQGLALGVFLIASLRLAWLTQRTVQDSLRIRFDNLALLHQLTDQREHAEEARGVAEEANTAKTRFFASASHDLRQPVQALGLYMSLLRKNPPERERAELIDRLGSCTESLEGLFNAILGVSQASSDGSPSAEAAPVSMQKLLEQALVQFAPEARAKGLRLRVRPSALWVRGDEAALGRILANLLANALRYTNNGTVLVGVRRSTSQHCQLIVADSGIGIAPHDQDMIFNEFYQVDNPNRDRSRGFGLGLATVRRLCDRLGARIEVRSQLGVGSLFAVQLERVARHAEAVVTSEMPVGELCREVLLVEDDLLVRDAMSRMLRSWGVAVQVCATGDEALQALSAAPGRCGHVLLDFRLADGEDGLEVSDRIRDRIAHPPPISLITGEANAAMREGAARRGIEVLTKPVKAIRLRALLQGRAGAAFGVTTRSVEPAQPAREPYEWPDAKGGNAA